MPSARKSMAVLPRTTRIIASPNPVQETPPRSSAYVPQPGKGESPMRPGSLLKIPPVEVATAIFPLASNTTHPTVPCFSAQRFLSCSTISDSGEHSGKPISRANISAPSLPRITCRPSSMTRRASLMGFLIRCNAATAPTRNKSPSMIAASISTLPI